MNEEFKVLIKEEKIKLRINQLAQQIEKDYYKKEIVMICILKGAVYFATELSKNVKNNITLDFMKVSSYGNNRETSGKINLILDISEEVKDKDVLIVEDIIDSGYTLDYLYKYISEKQPKSIKICVLLDKKERRIKNINADYVGFEIPDKFVIGYGLDYEGKYRNLPNIVFVENDK